MLPFVGSALLYDGKERPFVGLTVAVRPIAMRDWAATPEPCTELRPFVSLEVMTTKGPRFGLLLAFIPLSSAARLYLLLQERGE